jgi:hypothetical protein
MEEVAKQQGAAGAQGAVFGSGAELQVSTVDIEESRSEGAYGGVLVLQEEGLQLWGKCNQVKVTHRRSKHKVRRDVETEK